MNHLWSNRSRQVSYVALVCLGCMLTTVSRAGISVEPAWTLPVYERATSEQQAWVTNNMRSVVIKSAGGFQKSFAIGNPTLTTMCSLGHGTSSRRPDYYFGDQMTPPDPPAGYTLDWESMTNSAAVKSGDCCTGAQCERGVPLLGRYGQYRMALRECHGTNHSTNQRILLQSGRPETTVPRPLDGRALQCPRRGSQGQIRFFPFSARKRT